MTAPELLSLALAGAILLGCIAALLWLAYQTGQRRGYLRACEDFRRVDVPAVIRNLRAGGTPS